MRLKVWRHAGFECIIARNEEMGIINGYVGLPKEHPYFEISYSEIERDGLIEIHGGLTHSAIGGVGMTGEKDKPLVWPNPKLWYVGFDTGHSFDFASLVDNKTGKTSIKGYKWSKEGVIRETNKLAKQMRRIPCKEELVLLRSRGVTNDY